MAKKGEFLEYKGRPLVRCGNTIYYGSMADPFVVCLKVQSEKKQGDQTIADKVIIQLLNTDEQISPKEQVVKKSVAFNIRMRAHDRTLTDDEADAAMKRVVKALDKMGISLRS